MWSNGVAVAAVMSLRFGAPDRVKVAFVTTDKLVVYDLQRWRMKSERFTF